MAARSITRRGALAAAAGAAVLAGCTATEDGASVQEGGSAMAGNLDAGAQAAAPPITPVDSSGWDATYYRPAFSSSEESRAAAEAVAREVEAEGIVLLKNDGGALPLATGTRVSLLGRSAADTIFGGTGAAGIDTASCASLREGIEAAGLQVNAAPLEWISTVLADYPRGAVGALDRPGTVSHYVGEIPWGTTPTRCVRALREPWAS